MKSMRAENHKALERQVYEALYSAQSDFVSSEIREGLLGESEAFFCSRLKALARDADVLEIGCGTGQHSILAAQAGARSVLGTDISESAVAAARRAALQAKVDADTSFEVLDIESPQLAGKQFDLILNHEVFSSIDLPKALPHLRNLLKPGGTLLSIECLGENPLFNLNRRIGVLRGRRTSWAASHILRLREIDLMREYFPSLDIKYFHFLTLCAAPFWVNPIRKVCLPVVRFAQSADRKLLASGVLRRYAFKVVVEAR